MTEKKLLKYIDKPFDIHSTPFRSQPIILGNSIVNYLKDQCDSSLPLRFYGKAGTGYVYWLYWLERNLDWHIRRFRKLTLFVLLGTCDLTIKGSGRIIHLKHKSDEEAFNEITGYINRIKNFVYQFPEVTLIFLEVLPYSIVTWNRLKGVQGELYKQQDTILNHRIGCINDFIRQVNNQNNVVAPRLKSDIIRYRKRQGQREHRITVNLNLLKDGIHPSPLLAKCWVKKITTAAVSY